MVRSIDPFQIVLELSCFACNIVCSFMVDGNLNGLIVNTNICVVVTVSFDVSFIVFDRGGEELVSSSSSLMLLIFIFTNSFEVLASSVLHGTSYDHTHADQLQSHRQISSFSLA